MNFSHRATLTAEHRALTALIDLGVVTDREHLVRLLQERRADHIEALTHPMPSGVPDGLTRALRDTRLGEIALVEEALSDMGEPFLVVSAVADGCGGGES